MSKQKSQSTTINEVLLRTVEVFSKDKIFRNLIASGFVVVCVGFSVSLMVIASGVYHHLVGR